MNTNFQNFPTIGVKKRFMDESSNFAPAKRYKTENTHFTHLPLEIHNSICKYINFNDLANLAQTSKWAQSMTLRINYWLDICNDAKLPVKNTDPCNLRKAFKEAVNNKNPIALHMKMKSLMESKSIFSKKGIETTLQDLEYFNSMFRNDLEKNLKIEESYKIDYAEIPQLIHFFEEAEACLGFTEPKQSLDNSIEVLEFYSGAGILPESTSVAAKVLSIVADIKQGVERKASPEQFEELQKIGQDEGLAPWVRLQTDTWMAEATGNHPSEADETLIHNNFERSEIEYDSPFTFEDPTEAPSDNLRND